jgi:hypothetical protein
MKYSYVSYDWKQAGSEEEWESALNKLGVYMTLDPVSDGSDTYAFFLTTIKPTPEQIINLVREEWGAAALDEMGLSQSELLEIIRTYDD